MKRTIQMPGMNTRAAFEKSSYNAEARTIELVWSTGARVYRSSYFDGPWYEELSLDKRHLSLDRLNSGAPLLPNHNMRDLSEQLGVVEKAWIVSDKEARALVRFSNRSIHAETIKEITDGILRNVSVGYSTRKLEKIGEQDGVPILRAIDWEPFEISMVNVGADAGAGTRSKENETLFECEIVTSDKIVRTKNMEEETAVIEAPVKPETSVPAEGERAKAPEAPATVVLSHDDIRAEERVRISAIQGAFRAAGMDEALARNFIESGASVDSAREHVLNDLAKRSKTNGSNGVRITAGDQDDTQMKLRGISEAIETRIGIGKPTELSSDFRSFSAYDLAKECLVLKGINIRGMDRFAIATRALHSTSDFPSILSAATNKVLRNAYAIAPDTYGFFTQKRPVNDFKLVNVYGPGTMPGLLEVPEGSEYKRGTIGEISDSYGIKKYGRVLGFTEEMLINDDLGAFSDMPAKWGRAVRSLEANLAWNTIIGNPVMYDGVTLFNASHGNLALTPSAMSVTTIGEAIAALEVQQGLPGETIDYLNITAKYLIVPPALKGLALQLTAQFNPATFGTVNPYNYLTVVSDPRLSGTAWYVAADPAGGETVQHLYLQGREGPQLDERIGFDVDGIEYKVKHYAAFKALDWRWIYKNAGV